MDRLTPPLNERDHIQGPPDAATELVEYGDFECPHCKAAYPVISRLQAEFGGDLCFSYRHFPLADTHPLATFAAEAAEAAGVQGEFWQMHNALFEESPNLELPNLVTLAAALGFDLDRFGQDLASHRYLRRIRADVESGQRSGVHSTPTFFINGLPHEGEFDFDSLHAALLDAMRVPR